MRIKIQEIAKEKNEANVNYLQTFENVVDKYDGKNKIYQAINKFTNVHPYIINDKQYNSKTEQFSKVF